MITIYVSEPLIDNLCHCVLYVDTLKGCFNFYTTREDVRDYESKNPDTIKVFTKQMTEILNLEQKLPFENVIDITKTVNVPT